VDPVTVGEELRRNALLDEIGGLDFLLELQNATPSVSSADRYISIVQDTAMLRRLIHTASEIADIGYSDPKDIPAALDAAETKVFALAEEKVTDSMLRVSELTGSAMTVLEERYDSKIGITGLATGYHDLDDLLSGLQPGTLNIVGARPAMGKSAFALGMAVNVAKKTRRPVLFFSLEMSSAELTQRILSLEAMVDSDRMRSGKLQETDWRKLANALGRLDVPLYIDDNSQVSVMQIRQKVRRIAQRDSMPVLVIVDYLQLMGGGNQSENRQLEVSEISRNLKLLAREFNIPVVALSQLSRGVEGRSDRRPVLSDLRESGAIEQDADVVMFLYREEVHNPDNLQAKGWADVIVAKHRSGPIGTKKLVFQGQYTKFDNAARNETY
jgi:replicative DNA helicase